MKFSVHRDSLRKALMNVSHAINAKNAMPILANILVRTHDEHTISLAATNLEVGITCYVSAKIDQPGEITIPSKLSVDLVNNLPSEMIYVSVDSTAINMKCGQFNSTLMGIFAEDYPTLPSFNNTAALTLPRSFVDAIEHVIVAAATDDSRPVLTAVRMQVRPDTIELVCADGFRLALTKVSLNLSDDAAPTSMDLLIPAKTMTEVARIMRGIGDESIQFHVSENKGQVAFTTSQFEIVSRVIEGTYPDVTRVIPTEFKSEFVFKVSDLQRATKIAALVSTAGIKLIINNNQLAVISNGNQIGSSHATVEGTHTGDGHEISLNVKYLQDALSAVELAGGSQVVFKSNSNTTPAILQAVNNRNYVHIVMPIMVR